MLCIVQDLMYSQLQLINAIQSNKLRYNSFLCDERKRKKAEIHRVQVDRGSCNNWKIYYQILAPLTKFNVKYSRNKTSKNNKLNVLSLKNYDTKLSFLLAAPISAKFRKKISTHKFHHLEKRPSSHYCVYRESTAP